MSEVDPKQFLLDEWNKGSYDDCRIRRWIFFGDFHEDWEAVDDDPDFCQDSKYQHATNVLRHLPTGRTFMVYASRSGSYHTDWYYSFDEEPHEVRKVIKTVTMESWEAI